MHKPSRRTRRAIERMSRRLEREGVPYAVSSYAYCCATEAAYGLADHGDVDRLHSDVCIQMYTRPLTRVERWRARLTAARAGRQFRQAKESHASS
jgi:hypothetical protein